MPIVAGPARQPVKYREVERALRQEIATGVWQAGDRLPGEYDLAKQFNVSYLTVRQAVANLVEEGTLVRVRGKGTFVVEREAPAEPTTRHPMAILLPTNWQRRDPYYFPEVVQGFQLALEESGHRALQLNDIAVEVTTALPSGGAVACLLIGPEHPRLLEQLRDSGYRVLGINRYTGTRTVPTVRIDDALAVEQAVDYLVSLGHRRIGFLRGPADNVDAVERLSGFRAAVERHGLKATPEAGDDFGEASGYAGAQTLIALPNRPTALICVSDLAAIGAIRAASDLGFTVPEDLSIMGYGDFSVAQYVRPSLTTLRQCRADLGRTAAEMLIRLANGDDVQDEVLRAELVVRESTGHAGGSPT